MNERQCSIDACERKVTARGWCDTHYSRWKIHGSPLTVLRERRARVADPVCTIEGCNSPHSARGWCKAHYGQWQRTQQPQKFCSIDGCGRPLRARGWCGTHYMRWRTTGTTELVTATEDERFWPRVDLLGWSAISWNGTPLPGVCWNWRGASTPSGYGNFNNTYAHRWSYGQFIAPIPVGYEVDHLCRNTSCVNPQHLEAVTPDENKRRARIAQKNLKENA